MNQNDFYKIVNGSDSFETCNIVASLLDNINTDVDILFAESKENPESQDTVDAFLYLICKNVVSIAKLLYKIESVPSLEDVDEKAGRMMAAIVNYHRQEKGNPIKSNTNSDEPTNP